MPPARPQREPCREPAHAGADDDDVVAGEAGDRAFRPAGVVIGHHEAFEFARDALEKRAWELGLRDGTASVSADRSTSPRPPA